MTYVVASFSGGKDSTAMVHFIGCEKDPQYMPVIERRLKEVKIGGWFD